MRRALLALLVLLAGCSMPATDSEPDGVESVTPVPVTDADSVDRVTVETETPTERIQTPERPDGGEFADLLDDHEAALSNDSYAYEITITSHGESDRGENATINGYRSTNESVYFYEYASTGSLHRIWSNGSVRITAFGDRNRMDYEVSDDPRTLVGAGDRPDRLRQILSYAEPTDASKNETHYRINGTFVRKDNRSLLGPETAIEHSSLSLTVTTEGVIEAYRFEIRGRDEEDDRLHFVERFALDRSADALPRPEWVDRALSKGPGRR